MDEVLKFANEGGDTEPETAKIIAARNAKMEELRQASAKASETVAKAQQEAYDAHIAATNEIMGDPAEEPNLTGAPVPPTATPESQSTSSAPAEKKESAAKSS